MNNIDERMELCLCRIRDIRQSEEDRYFQEVSNFILEVFDVVEKLKTDTTLYKAINEKIYTQVKDKTYESSIYNPEVLAKYMDEEEARIFSALAYNLLEIYVLLLENNYEEVVCRLELFVQCASIYLSDDENKIENLREAIYYHNFDYLDESLEKLILDNFIKGNEHIKNIILNEDLYNENYLYKIGAYIDNNTLRTSKMIAGLSNKQLDIMSDAIVDGYIRGFELANKPIYKKKYISVIYELGFELYVKKIIEKIEQKGFKAVVLSPSGSPKRLNLYPACDYDHKNFESIYIDKAYIDRKVAMLDAAFNKYKDETILFAGPLVSESFGKDGFEFVNKNIAYKLSEKQNNLKSAYNVKYKELYNKYINFEERSFAIISWPDANISNDDKIFKEIFDEIVAINTIDIKSHTKIQQYLIDALDKSDYIVVTGKGKNTTNMRVQLYKLKDPSKETIFENCGADVNIPVGEVFTSPVLKGTNGTLHVGNVYIREVEFKNLKIEFVDGMVVDYSCSNFKDLNESKTLIENIIFGYNKKLPIGEFAIGTNTRAYTIAKKYKIFNKLPILIAEKTGPHFAVGDTCYSNEEDMMTYNPDGKAIVARENEISALRHCKDKKAYFGCHTDITIPYDELGEIYGVTTNGEKIHIIRDGKFVLQGTEPLNDYL